MNLTTSNNIDFEMTTENTDFEIDLKTTQLEPGIQVIHLQLNADSPTVPSVLHLKWTLPSINVKGVWKTSSLYEKRLQADWELEALQSRISVDAPVISLFGHDDQNCQTFACSDALNAMELNARIREEDNLIYCHLSFFTEKHQAIKSYRADVRIDTRAIPFDQALQDLAAWWADAYYPPMEVPAAASYPLYSSWYNFHQELSEEQLIEECKIAAKLGYRQIIIDDGWQTMDNNRGYDYTGDWKAERLNMPYLVKKIHDLGMKIGLWYSVPFIGEKSAAYQKFKGKFLTEDHRWAPVADPRYPEVRDYLVNTYVQALKDWDLDGFKLDFIDDFKVYESTVLTKENGRDYANVNAAVERLLVDVKNALQAIKPDIIIEFRQKYIGPALRQFGNMFRAFDCPNDSHTNRLRTTDVRLLCGSSAVHSDPLTWHSDESVELAALQVLNGFFAVPQMSVVLQEIPESHLQMIAFYTQYWNAEADLIMKGQFRAFKPLAHYPILKVTKDSKSLIGLFEDHWIDLDVQNCWDILNAKTSEVVLCKSATDLGECEVIIWDCMGQIQDRRKRLLSAGFHTFDIPAAGMMRIERIAS